MHKIIVIYSSPHLYLSKIYHKLCTSLAYKGTLDRYVKLIYVCVHHTKYFIFLSENILWLTFCIYLHPTLFFFLLACLLAGWMDGWLNCLLAGLLKCTCLLACLLTYLLTSWLTYLLACLLACLLDWLFTFTYTYSLAYLLICLLVFACLLTHSLTHSLTQVSKIISTIIRCTTDFRQSYISKTAGRRAKRTKTSVLGYHLNVYRIRSTIECWRFTTCDWNSVV